MDEGKIQFEGTKLDLTMALNAISGELVIMWHTVPNLDKFGTFKKKICLNHA